VSLEFPALSAKVIKMYKIPKATTDIIIEKDGKIVLVTRGIKPFIGKLALPGGHVEYGETVEKATVREAEEETGLKIKVKGILGVYSDPERSPNISISTVFIGEIIGGELKAGTDAKMAKFYKVEELKREELAFDHYKMIQDYIKWKQKKGTYWSSK